MPKKARGARREARNLSIRLAAAEQELKTARGRMQSLELQLQNANHLAARLTQTEMRSQWQRDAESFRVSLTITSAMLDECRYSYNGMEQLLGWRFARELQRAAYKRADVEPLFGGIEGAR